MACSACPGALASPLSARAAGPSEATAALALSGLRPVTITPRAPATKNAWAAERPRPVVPPMTTNTFSARGAEASGMAKLWPVHGPAVNDCLLPCGCCRSRNKGRRQKAECRNPNEMHLRSKGLREIDAVCA